MSETARIDQPSEDVLIVSTTSSPRAEVFLGAVVILVAAAGFLYVKDPARIQGSPLLGLVIAAGGGLVSVLLLFERSAFVFDRRQQHVRWSRRRVFRRRSGVIPFAAITGVAVQSPIGDEGIPSRRVALVTAEGDVPLSVSYRPDPHDRSLALASRIREFTGQPAGDALMASVRVAVSNGRIPEAVRLLRSGGQMTLTEAMARIEEIRRTGADGGRSTHPPA